LARLRILNNMALSSIRVSMCS